MHASFNKRSTADDVTRGIDLQGTTILLTGCNSGLGFETLRVLVNRGAHVIAAARNLETARAACARVAGGSAGTVTPLACDLGDFDSVRQAIASVMGVGWRLDRIIANAGIMMLPRLEQIQGIEKQFVVNYLGHFLLINGVLGAVPRHAGARIVILASRAHRQAPRVGVELDNLSGEHGYGAMRAYGQTNVARILFARALARRLKDSGITVNSLHPGVIGTTNLFRHMNLLLALGIRLFSKTVPQGAATQCYLAANPEVAEVTGQYFSDCRIAQPSRVAQDDELGERLWSVSERLIA